MLNTQTQLAIASASGTNPVTMITGIKYTANLVKVFNNITFLYDPNWEYEAGNPTYPIAFFHVKSMTESMNADISSKPLLFYNSASDATDGTRSGILNIVSDNIVSKPKIYKLDVLIPANASTFKNASFSIDSMSHVWNFLAQCDASTNKLTSEVMRIANTNIDILESLLKGLYGTAVSVSSICNMLLQQQDYNKASIEYMWRNRRILKLKMWNGWKFKYLAIQNFEITKTGENGDFYEGTLLCQELPILTFRNQAKTSLGFMSTISSALGQAQKTVAKFFIDTMTSSIGE